MKTCSYYRTRFKGAEDATCGYCIGTKDCESCSCGGNELKCNFYEHIRERALLEQVKSAKPTITAASPINQDTLIRRLIDRSIKEEQELPWWVCQEIYNYHNKGE